MKNKYTRILITGTLMLVGSVSVLSVVNAWTNTIAADCGTLNLTSQNGDVVTTDKWNQLVCAVMKLQTKVDSLSGSVSTGTSASPTIGWENVSLYDTAPFDENCQYRYKIASPNTTSVLQWTTFVRVVLPYTLVTYPDIAGWLAWSLKIDSNTKGMMNSYIVSSLEKLCYSSIAGTTNTPLVSTYPWCDKPDITLPNGQVWAACNVGSSVAGLWSASYGNYYQLGRNDPWFILPSHEFWTPWTQWPCSVGYHIPTYSEWHLLADAIDMNNTNIPWTTRLATIQKYTDILKLPLAGMRDKNSGQVVDSGSLGSYWHSSGDVGAVGILPSVTIYPGAAVFGENGFSVRCIKN